MFELLYLKTVSVLTKQNIDMVYAWSFVTQAFHLGNQHEAIKKIAIKTLGERDYADLGSVTAGS